MFVLLVTVIIGTFNICNVILEKSLNSVIIELYREIIDSYFRHYFLSPEMLYNIRNIEWFLIILDIVVWKNFQIFSYCSPNKSQGAAFAAFLTVDQTRSIWRVVFDTVFGCFLTPIFTYLRFRHLLRRRRTSWSCYNLIINFNASLISIGTSDETPCVSLTSHFEQLAWKKWTIDRSSSAPLVKYTPRLFLRDARVLTRSEG